MTAGDLVKLNSDGPMMTVEYVDTSTPKDYSIVCSWFDGNILQSGEFRRSMLTPQGE